jgi:hypothetical protein
MRIILSDHPHYFIQWGSYTTSTNHYTYNDIKFRKVFLGADLFNKGRTKIINIINPARNIEKVKS